ncbi:hypothetical protein AXG93_3217s1950 [Marchantia polymorpha subsp. ruderalis]|uniref:Polyphenol oxidase C-terminal domain-containing protein n=1 Tax=Marchantia polymorpha subsp. ruderalis TaxID=1480154 RepID=A0A176VWP4_MARPO|nr:hypothetical protein AXG93_3217s1950 [Marchantia polymorpha subsp. ruderalis]
MLLWASYLCSIVLLLQYVAQPACADPVLASRVGFCKPVRLEATAEEKNRIVQCCLPALRRAVKRFKLPHVHHLRVRRPAHELANDVDYKRSDVRVSTSNAIGRHPTSFKLTRRAPTAADLRGTQAQNVNQLSEGVVFEHVRVPELMYVRFDVFLDSPTATAETDEDESAYVGTFTHLPSGVTTVTDLGQKMVHVEDDDMYRTLNIRFSTSLALKRLGVTDWNTDITVTVVPRFRPHGYGWNIKALKFDCLRQEFT